jgi:Cu/Ag efflux protein CusF
MRIKFARRQIWIAVSALTLGLVLTCTGCSKPNQTGPSAPSPPGEPATPQPSASPFVKTTTYYDGMGTVTKIDEKMGVLELDHGDIPGYMTAMKMEYYVDDKIMLTGLKVGEKVDFTVKDFSGVVTLSAVKPHVEGKK